MSSFREDCYHVPQYWDLAFRDETADELHFLRQAAAHYVSGPVRRILEPGCGGGRQVVACAAAGWQVTAFDLSHPAVRYVRRRLRRRGFSADVQVADMREFRSEQPMDLAHCFVNTFRHLLTEADAVRHLQAVAACLRPGGVYLLGLHLLPPDAEELDRERWAAVHGATRVTVTLKVTEFCRRRREETLRFNLHVRRKRRGKADEVRRFCSEYRMRIYRADQFRSLLDRVPEFELLAVHDFCYELDATFPLDDRLGDAVFVLRRQ